MSLRKPPEKHSDGIFSGLIHGRWLSTRFFSRYWGPILLIMGMIIFYIANRYDCLSKMEEIKHLERELEVVRSEAIRQKSAYMSNTRESVMTERINAIGLDLSVSTHPPYRVEK
ncbi:MAG: hypothetical protein K2G64_00865 [Muribaculaceae bacterium]|nr:hypothetical protein [Muribaculaceae bacterium]MDE5967630.1 hypothetical protein [Muribaculaceae bacterium]